MYSLSKRQLNTLLLILSIVGILVVIIYGITLHKKGDAPLNKAGFTGFNDAWIIQTDEGGMTMSLPAVADVKAGEAVSISHQTPSNLNDDTVLYFRTEYQAVEVKLDNQIIYSYGVDEVRPLGKSTVPAYHMVSLGKVCSDKNLTITYLSMYNKYAGELPVISYGAAGDVLYSIWQDNIWIFILSILLIIVSIIVIMVYIFMGKLRHENSALGLLVVFLWTAAIWSISDNKIMQLYINSLYVLYLLKSMVTLIIPVVYLMYVRCFIDKKKIIKYVDFGIGIYGANFVTALVLQVLGLVDLFRYMVFTEILIFIGLVIITIVLGIAVITFGKRSLRDIVVANIIFIIFILLDFIIGIVEPDSSIHGIILRIGIFAYVICMLVVTERNMIWQVEKKKESEIETINNQKIMALNSLNPNFIFASLNLILELMKKGSDTGQLVLFQLSKYIRYKFNALKEDRKLVMVTEELEHASSYLYIEKMRHKELTVAIEDKVTDFKMPPYIIGPLVENAVKHGMSKKNYVGNVSVRSYETKNYFAVQIIDNGIGFDINTIKKDTFTSIKNIRERLDTIDAEMDIVSKKGKGTVITIRLPKLIIE